MLIIIISSAQNGGGGLGGLRNLCLLRLTAHGLAALTSHLLTASMRRSAGNETPTPVTDGSCNLISIRVCHGRQFHRLRACGALIPSSPDWPPTLAHCPIIRTAPEAVYGRRQATPRRHCQSSQGTHAGGLALESCSLQAPHAYDFPGRRSATLSGLSSWTRPAVNNKLFTRHIHGGRVGVIREHVIHITTALPDLPPPSVTCSGSMARCSG